MTKNKAGDKKNVWKGIQKRLSTSRKPQENEKTKTEENKLKSLSMTSVEEFKEIESEGDDYFQTEETVENKVPEEEFKKSKEELIKPEGKSEEEPENSEGKPEEKAKNTEGALSEMALILPALQNHEYDSEDDNKSLKDPNEAKFKDVPVERKSVEEPNTAPEEIKLKKKSMDTFKHSPAEDSQVKEVLLPLEIGEKSEPERAENTQDSARAETNSIESAKDLQISSIDSKNDSGIILPSDSDSVEKKSLESTEPIKENPDTSISLFAESSAPAENDVLHNQEKEKHVENNKTTDQSIDSANENQKGTKEQNKPEQNRLASILPGVEESLKNIASTSDLKKSLEAQFPTEKKTPEDSTETPDDFDLFKDNTITIEPIEAKDVPVNNLKPRQQEEADQQIRDGMKLLFDNRFMEAKKTFETKSTVDPLYALGLGAMAFIKAIMTFHEFDRNVAMTALATAYTIAKAQIDNTCFKKPFKDTVSQYFNSIMSSSKNGLPADPPASTMPNIGGGLSDPSAFMPNGLLRAHVIKAECCLLMGILQMTQESVVGYLKCGLNLKTAYNSYSIVWREYKRMGQEYTKYIDCDTVSAIQFGIGSVHLILSSMPQKILKIFSLLGWKSDKQLGFALLKLCLEGRGIRSPLASLMLLSYYSILTSFAPQLYTDEMMNPAIECLLDAQNRHPNSCFFLFFAARISRVAKNIPLSTQSFQFASESSKGEWTEVAMKQLSDYEIGFNYALQLNWQSAIQYFEQLVEDKYWSPAFSQYFLGSCHEMMGQRTEAILAFAKVPMIKDQAKKSYIDSYVEKKVEFFQKSGYQDLDFSLPAIEILLVLNAFEYLEKESLETCLEKVESTLGKIYEREKIEYDVRLRELVPASAPPDYYDQRCILLLAKASILNSMGRYEETIPHLNWVLDHRDCISHESWIIPFTYWESGNTSWGMNNYVKSRKLWQLAMGCTKYDFEYRMAIRLSLALSKCEEMGVTHIDEKELKGESTNNRKRMPMLSITPHVV